MSKINPKHLDIYLKTQEGRIFAKYLLEQIFDGFNVINGKIIDTYLKERPHVVIDLDEVAKRVEKRQKRR